MSDGVFTSAAARRGAVVRVVLLGGAVVAVTAGIWAFLPSATDPAWVRQQLAGLGWYAPLAFVALQAVQVIVAPIPGQILGGVAGYLFGAPLGVTYSMIGVTAGSAAVFGLSRRFGRPYVERVIDPGRLATWDAFFERSGTVGLFGLFLLPTFPDDLLCVVAGLADVRLRTFLVLVVVGRTPSFLVAAYVGTRVADGAVVAAVTVAGVLIVLSAGVYHVRDRVLARLRANG
jgi:uncharacterized membrane protein YdjX (TVP38/TMEM64 family)